VTGVSGTDVYRLLHIQTQFRHATLKQHKLPIEHALLTALQKDLERFIAQASATTKKGKPGTIRRESMVARLADYQGMKATVGLYAEMLGMRQQEIARSLDTLQQTARTLLDTAAGAASDDDDGDTDDAGQQPTSAAAPEPVGATAAGRLMYGGEGPPRSLFSARRRRGVCARAAPVDDTGHTRPAGAGRQRRGDPWRPMTAPGSTTRGQADEIDANAHGLRMIAGAYVTDGELQRRVDDVLDAGERVKERLAEIDDAHGPQAPATPGN